MLRADKRYASSKVTFKCDVRCLIWRAYVRSTFKQKHAISKYFGKKFSRKIVETASVFNSERIYIVSVTSEKTRYF